MCIISWYLVTYKRVYLYSKCLLALEIAVQLLTINKIKVQTDLRSVHFLQYFSKNNKVSILSGVKPASIIHQPFVV